MQIDHQTFFTYIRRSPFGGRLTEQQVDGINDCLAFMEKAGLMGDLRLPAYLLATFHHETGGRMVPVRETFASSTKQAIARLDAAWRDGKLPQVSKPYWRDGWFGRGRVQVTHAGNYARVQDKTGIPVLDKPDLLLDSKTDCRVSIPGTVEGWWTRGAHKLGDYFNDADDDAVGARRVVNGTDKARHIAENLYEPFLAAFEAARTDTPLPVDVSPEMAKPDGKPLINSTTVWSAAGTAGAGIVAAFRGGISDMTALIEAFALIDQPVAFALAVNEAVEDPIALCAIVVASLGGWWIIRERRRHRYEGGV
jgi:putative chitinase